MATEAAPRGKAKRGVISETRTVSMTKTAPEVDYARLETYQGMGYEVKEEPWRYVLTGSQAEYEKRQAFYQQQGIAQAERANVTRDAEGLDNDRERTISTSTRVAMTAEDLLSSDEADGLNP